jgi:hypothetical protein
MARVWTPERLELLDEWQHEAVPAPEIAARLGVKPTAVPKARHRYHLKPQRLAVYTIPRLARLFGLSRDRVSYWIESGRIRAVRRNPACSRSQWLITEQGLTAFMRRRDAWPFWSVKTITDPAWREWARELRGHERMLTVAEVAARYYVVPLAVRRWCQQGRLTGSRKAHSHCWLIPESALTSFVPPSVLSRPRRPRPYTGREDELILRLRASGVSWSGLGKRLGRDSTSVHRHWQWLTEEIAVLLASVEVRRQQLGLDQRDIAVAISVTPETWSRYRAGQWRLTERMRLRLQGWLDSEVTP